jgi:diaminopimelate decarboxylase
MRVVDVKTPTKIIADAGVNLIGWEGLRYDYEPIINLSDFSTTEKDCRVYGNLCMADDIWGYSCFAKKIRVGDLLVMPYQGAYTFSLAQNFIKPIPPVYDC